MAPVTNYLVDDLTTDHDEYQTLVGNRSVDSFILDKNEFTITRAFGDRKCSTMSFKQHNSQQNVMDVVITTSHPKHEKDATLIHHITSQDIRRKYSTRAKCGVAFVLTMLLVMFVILVVCVLVNVQGHRSKTGEVSQTTSVVAHHSLANATVVSLTTEAAENVTNSNISVPLESKPISYGSL